MCLALGAGAGGGGEGGGGRGGEEGKRRGEGKGLGARASQLIWPSARQLSLSPRNSCNSPLFPISPPAPRLQAAQCFISPPPTFTDEKATCAQKQHE